MKRCLNTTNNICQQPLMNTSNLHLLHKSHLGYKQKCSIVLRTRQKQIILQVKEFCKCSRHLCLMHHNFKNTSSLVTFFFLRTTKGEGAKEETLLLEEAIALFTSVSVCINHKQFGKLMNKLINVTITLVVCSWTGEVITVISARDLTNSSTLSYTRPDELTRQTYTSSEIIKQNCSFLFLPYLLFISKGVLPITGTFFFSIIL